jgi:hypothetical protein
MKRSSKKRHTHASSRQRGSTGLEHSSDLGPSVPESAATLPTDRKGILGILAEIQSFLAKDLADMQVQAARLTQVQDFIRVYFESPSVANAANTKSRTPSSIGGFLVV